MSCADLFVRQPAEDVIFGYADEVVEMAGVFLPPEVLKVPGRFGLLAGMNGTSLGRYRVKSGVLDPARINEVVAFDGVRQFDAWKTDDCNRLAGGGAGEGSWFPPGIDRDDELRVFVPDMCGAIKLSFGGDVVHHDGIPSMRFLASPSNFDYGLEENECYCVDDNGGDWIEDFAGFGGDEEEREEACEGKVRGVFDVAPCKLGVPLLLSWPHLLDADEAASEGVEGLSPNRSKHALTMDFEPTLGLGLSARVRLQLNMVVHKAIIVMN